ncbi:hypothetical protein [Roseicella aquatilis]|uniref:Holdfast attachment protein HfaA n=1 Tax=Roseicella aquatilis TaxID=2527868 RepID=A0A4R4DSL2_9PROT|nr:hypothetical protein [Roseicella aquatilis]TCZ64355.1 hypothetical protein EXY23_06825 [Roseicella aquatilis]
MLRSLILASTLAVTLSGAALAQGGPRMVGGGPDAVVTYDAQSQNVVGGGVASYAGGGVDERIAYGGRVTTEAPTGLIAEITGEANNRHIVYHAAPVMASGILAGHQNQPRG